MKKILLLFLCCAMLFSLISCEKEEESLPDQTNEVTTEETVTEPSFLVKHLANYSVIYPDEGVSLTLLKEIRALQTALNEKFGIKITSKSDFIGLQNDVKPYEILIGQTNREESDAVYAQVPRAEDYAVCAYHDKIVIAGWTEEKLILAIQALVKGISELPSDSACFFNESMQTIVKGTYTIEDLKLGDTSISDYTLVYEPTDACLSLAQKLQKEIQACCGYVLPIYADTDVARDGKKILIGNTVFPIPADLTNADSADQYYVGMSNADLYLYGTDIPAASKAVESFLVTLSSAKGPVAVLNPNEGVVISADTSMTAMSFNILVNNVTEERVARVISMIRTYMPDTLGVQEASEAWMAILSEQLAPDYAYVGIGRDSGGTGEHSAVFYKKDKFTLVESGTKWMSDTPDQVSKVEGSICNRVFSYALLERKSDGVRFMHVNVHTDHAEDNSIRLKQVQALMKFVENYPDLPILISGDFNNEVGTPAISHILNSGMENSAAIALDGDDSPTFKQKVIDFFFVSEGDFDIYEYSVDLSKINGELPSDHYPIMIRYDVK